MKKRMFAIRKGMLMKKQFTRKSALIAVMVALLCVSVSAQVKKDSKGKSGSGRGRYRVTLIGFTAHNQTWDHAGQVDGKDDEVYIVSDVRMFNRAGAEIQAPSTSRSQVMGDTNGYAYRVKAGSASDRGGIKSGDSFPDSTPWMRRGAINRDRPPMMLWEGDLVADQNVAVIIPTVWEWDGGEDMFSGWRRTIAANGAAIGGAAVTFAYGPAAGAATATALQVALPAASNLLGDVIGNAGDRPIGAQKNGSGSWVFNPRIITLTYQIAENTIANDLGKGRGVVSVPYEDSSELRGNYTLYVQVERISSSPAPAPK
ncbi:MAG: hypothetical protein ABR554_01460 [Pyrinomonadaceae bacterium]